jgi:hypothetical protein
MQVCDHIHQVRYKIIGCCDRLTMIGCDDKLTVIGFGDILTVTSCGDRLMMTLMVYHSSDKDNDKLM